MVEKKKVFALITLLALLPTIVQAFSLSTLQKKNFADVRPGQTAEFTVLFWNLEDNPTPISFKVRESPDGWVTVIKPENLLLNKSKIGPPYNGNEYIGIPNVGDVETFSAKVFVQVPEDADLGKYDTFVTITAGEPSSGISIVQGKTFRFTTNVIKAPISFETSEETSPDNLADRESAIDKLTGMLTSPESNILLPVTLSIIVIIMVIWTVYKRV